MEFSNAFHQLAVQFIVVLFVVGGLAALAIGVGLIVASAGTLRFIAVMNRWVSTRRAYRPIEVTSDVRQAVQKHRRWLAMLLIVGAAYALYGLVALLDLRAVVFIFGLDMRSVTTSWLVEAARWALVLGNLVALVIGTLLVFFPAAWAALKARGRRWYADRQLVKGADEMHLTLDNWAASSPRTAGWIITIAALILLGAFGFVLSVIY